MFDPLSLLAIFAPVAVDAGKALVQKFIAPESVHALSVQDKLQLDAAEIERLKVIAAIDKPADNCHAWVSDVRAMMRPVVVISVTAAWCFMPEKVDAFLVSSVWFYLFGERSLKK